MGQGFLRYKEAFQWLGRRRDANHRQSLATLRELQALQTADPEEETPEMASNPEPAAEPPAPEMPAPDLPPEPYRPAQAPPPMSGWHPNPAHPPIEECPNCSRLGYPSIACQFKKPKAG